MEQDALRELARRNAELLGRVDALSRALAQAEAVTQLTAGVVHDLRNAFHVTLVAAEMLVRGLKHGDQRELAEAVVAAAQHGSALARDLLAVARTNDGRTSVVNGAEFLGGFQRMLQRIAHQRFDFAVDVDPQLWPVVVQRPQLEAALINLCANARDAMPGGGRLRVGMRNWPRDRAPLPQLPQGDYVEYSVSDSGSGMPPNVLARATEAFFTTKGDSGGTGLGLAMAQAFASRSGGALLIDSEPGRGTTVRIVLPRAPVTPTIDPSVNAKLQEMSARIRTPELRQALEAWRTVCPTGGLPQPVAAEGSLTAFADHCLVLAADHSANPPLLRLLRMGSAVSRALGGAQLGELSVEGPVALGTLAAAYRRSLQSSFPSYEYARYAFEGVPAVFERMILPAASDGRNVSHLIGLIYISGDLEMGGKEP